MRYHRCSICQEYWRCTKFNCKRPMYVRCPKCEELTEIKSVKSKSVLFIDQLMGHWQKVYNQMYSFDCPFVVDMHKRGHACISTSKVCEEHCHGQREFCTDYMNQRARIFEQTIRLVDTLFRHKNVYAQQGD